MGPLISPTLFIMHLVYKGCLIPILYDSIQADESIFRFGSIRFDSLMKWTPVYSLVVK